MIPAARKLGIPVLVDPKEPGLFPLLRRHYNLSQPERAITRYSY